jgi:hypothetical protein
MQGAVTGRGYRTRPGCGISRVAHSIMGSARGIQ